MSPPVRPRTIRREVFPPSGATPRLYRHLVILSTVRGSHLRAVHLLRERQRSWRDGRRRRGMLLPRRSAPNTGRSAASAGGSAPRLRAVSLTAALGCATANLLCACPRRWQKRGFAELLRPLPGKTIRQRLVCSNEAVEMPLPPVCLRQPPAQSLKSQDRCSSTRALACARRHAAIVEAEAKD